MSAIIKTVKEGEPAVDVLVQRHLNAKASNADIAAEVENDRQVTVRDLLRPMVCRLKCFKPVSSRISTSPRTAQVRCPNWTRR